MTVDWKIKQKGVYVNRFQNKWKKQRHRTAIINMLPLVYRTKKAHWMWLKSLLPGLKWLSTIKFHPTWALKSALLNRYYIFQKTIVTAQAFRVPTIPSVHEENSANAQSCTLSAHDTEDKFSTSSICFCRKPRLL